jgi:hypothetical protein
MAEIHVQGMDEVRRMLAKLTGPQLKLSMRRATRKIGEMLRNEMQQAPGPANSPVKWASKKQRAWYFAMRRQAGLPMEYTRESDPMSQRLLRGWTGQPHGESGYIVGTRATYAPYVQSSEHQTEQHKATGWKTDEQAVEEIERSGVIKRVVEAEINSLLRSL